MNIKWSLRKIWNRLCTFIRWYYHTTHFLTGFILVPFAQQKSLAKSSLLDMGPIIRNFSMECWPVRIWFFIFSVRYLEHQAWKATINIENSKKNSIDYLFHISQLSRLEFLCFYPERFLADAHCALKRRASAEHSSKSTQTNQLFTF